MSHATFHTEHASAALKGMEFHHAGAVTKRITAGLLFGGWNALDAVLSHLVEIPPSLFRAADDDHRQAMAMLTTAFAVGDLTFQVGDRRCTCMELQINTAVAVGNDPTRLLGRIYGQGDIHGWVSEPNRAWAANIIDAGLESGLYRPGMGWETVAGLFRNGDGGPVVTSYSVEDWFPNPTIAGFPDDTQDELAGGYYDLSPAEKWERAVAGLNPTCEWSPDTLPMRGFGGGLTAFDLAVPAPDRAAAR